MSYCPNCNRLLVSIDGNILYERCPYCSAELNTRNQDGNDNQDYELIKKKEKIECWYCHHLNDFQNTICSKCGWDLSVSMEKRNLTDENKLINILNDQELELCLIEGIKAIIKIIIQRQGNNNNMIKCQTRGCNGFYKYDAFVCPSCGNPTLMEELRNVLRGNVVNSSLISLLSRFFPQFKIVKYTTSAVMPPEQISVARVDLESASREVSNVLISAGTFLRSITTQSFKDKKNKEKKFGNDPSRFNELNNDLLNIIVDGGVNIDEGLNESRIFDSTNGINFVSTRTQQQQQNDIVIDPNIQEHIAEDIDDNNINDHNETENEDEDDWTAI